ncbi:DNA mismatch repair protein MutL [Rickenella mellea]|uniref:DNA mismatch repair protein PMS1 n=1 Tax=Rickenella mellea TaxID=50990 RepID=A0A4Y7PS50_9AGAM|nr:DNA mismatch repair protein MutL [Rickenella mellea]
MIKSIDATSIHRITSGQVVVDLQTAVKELVENSLDAGATNIEVRLKEYGLTSIEVIDSGSGISPDDYDKVGLKHHTSKLQTFEDLSIVRTFGFRGEALSSLCALSERVVITTATSAEAPMGTVLELDHFGKVKSRSSKVARQRGTTVTIEGLFKPLPVRRKEYERNSKLQLGKALNLLSAYALVPCAQENKGVRLSVYHQPDGGKKTLQIRTDGTATVRASISSLWGPKQLENLVELDLHLDVSPEKTTLKRLQSVDTDTSTKVHVRGLISKFYPGRGRTGTDRQYFFINGRPCNPSKIQKAFNEVYRTFNANQSPFIVADFILPTNACDINVSPDKRTIFLHSENNLVAALKEGLEDAFSSSRSTYAVQGTSTQSQQPTQSMAAKQNAKSGGQATELHEDVGTADQLASISPSLHGPPADAEELRQTTESQRLPLFLDEPTSSEDSFILNSDRLPSSDNREQNDGLASSHPMDKSTEVVLPLPGPSMQTQRLATENAGPSSLQPAVQRQPSPNRPPLQADLVDKRNEVHDNGGTPSVSPPPPQTRTVDRSHPILRRQSTPRSVQLVLDTSQASWNLRKASSDREEPPTKKTKTDTLSKGGSARERLRTQLIGFARAGSQVSVGSGVEDRVKEEGDEGEDVDMLESGEEDDAVIQERDVLVEEDEMEADEITVKQEDDLAVIPFRRDAGVRSPPGPPPEKSPAKQSTVKSEVIDMDLDDAVISAEREANLRALSRTPEDSSSVSSSSVHHEVIRTANGDQNDITLTFDTARVSGLWRHVLDSRQAAASKTSAQSASNGDNTHLSAAGIEASLANPDAQESAEQELSRVIHKEDFMNMQILGQFNLGFIIARKHTESQNEAGERGSGVYAGMDDLFIIDQHAADEKYNFETLQQTTKIESQRLYQPRPLELTAADELLAAENIDILRSNGFEIATDESADHGQGGRVKLVAQPVSGNTNFDLNDLEELLQLMRDQATGKMVRCSKARAMFAMRACRKSVMVGAALTHGQMTSIVRHMATMDQPWNCPHGRPTMRHLFNIADTSQSVESRTIDWSSL